VKVTGEPDIATQMVRGSAHGVSTTNSSNERGYLPEPIFSVVNPCVLMTEPGTVTGIVVLQVLPIVVSVTAVIVRSFGSVANVSFGEQASLVMRLEKPLENYYGC
jgi:hypothetical protein